MRDGRRVDARRHVIMRLITKSGPLGKHRAVPGAQLWAARQAPGGARCAALGSPASTGRCPVRSSGIHLTLAETAPRLAPALEPRYYRDPEIAELEEER